MTTKFHELRLPGKIVESVVNLTSQHCIDLNTVMIDGTRIVVGEPRCGKVIHVVNQRTAFGYPEKYYIGMYDLSMNRAVYREVVTL